VEVIENLLEYDKLAECFWL